MKWHVLNDLHTEAALSDCGRYTVCVVYLGAKRTYEAWLNPVRRGRDDYAHTGKQLAIRLRSAAAAQRACEQHAQSQACADVCTTTKNLKAFDQPTRTQP